MMRNKLINPSYFAGLIVLVLTGGLWIGCDQPGVPAATGEAAINRIDFNYNKWDRTAYLAAAATDDLNGNPVDSIMVQISSPTAPHLGADLFALNDSGAAGDILPEDNIHALIVSVDSTTLAAAFDSISQLIIKLEVHAFFPADTIIDSARYDLSNYRPRILDVSMPLVMYIPCGSGYDLDTLVVSAADSNGLDDIQICYLNFEKPDGSLSSGSPISLYDDGRSDPGYLIWDERASDGKFSRLILIDINSDEGVHQCHYFLRDYSGLISDEYLLELVVLDTCSTGRGQ